jgi:hypothetical protein
LRGFPMAQTWVSAPISIRRQINSKNNLRGIIG